MAYSQIYLEEALTEAKKLLPGWAYALIVQRARARVVGLARPSASSPPATVQKIALADIRPSSLLELTNGELLKTWKKLNALFSEFGETDQPTENVVNAALWTIDEMRRRGGFDIDSSAKLTQAVEVLRRATVSKDLASRLSQLPQELVVVPDFVNLVGSAAKGKDNPKDVDIAFRAKRDHDGSFLIASENIWLPLRSVLDPDKSGCLHFIGNPQGPHGDYVSLFDLVLRRRMPFERRVVKGLPSGTAESGIHVHTLQRENMQTNNDGSHEHLFILPPQFAAQLGAESLRAQDGGSHVHRFGRSDVDFIGLTGDHDHVVILPSGETSGTETDGAHAHQLQTASTVFDGIHRHKLLLPGGTEVWSLLPSENWERQGSPEQASTPDAPPASELAKSQESTCVTPPIVFAVSEPHGPDEAFSRDDSVTFDDLYLKPLGLERKDVAIIYTDAGLGREPMSELQADIVIALGKRAREALGSRADFGLPHPGPVRRLGASNELPRKLKAIAKRLALAKQRGLGEEGGEGRGPQALRNWREKWHTMLPPSGKGRFVYQHHWRGLEENEEGLSDRQLLNTNNSLHGDIRFQGSDGLWGWAVLIGSAADNKAEDKLFGLEPDDNLRLAPKLLQPDQWLKVGVGKPFLAKPGEVGATSQRSAKLFALDQGTYTLGVARQNAVEVFLDGKKLKGRYLMQFAPVGGERIWLIDKPEDQTPIAERRDAEDVIRELRGKRQKFLIWSKPGQRPQKFDVRTGKVVKRTIVSIAKADEAKQIVYGVVLDPYQVDAHGDWVPPGVIEDSAHAWLKKSRIIGLDHKELANAKPVESWVESYPSKADYDKARRGKPHRVFRRQFGTDTIHSGAWVIGTELDDTLWAAFKDGELTGYSIGGFGHRTPIKPQTMPEVEFVELTEAQELESI